jgi:hypothetical protein
MNRGLLTFAGCMFLFQMANASMLPLAGESLVYSEVPFLTLIVSALIIVPQVIVAMMAPWAGRRAKTWRFAALPIRSLDALEGQGRRPSPHSLFTAASIFGTKITKAAWRTRPSCYIVASNDRMISPDQEKSMAKQMKATTTILPSSYVAMQSHPREAERVNDFETAQC